MQTSMDPEEIWGADGQLRAIEEFNCSQRSISQAPRI